MHVSLRRKRNFNLMLRMLKDSQILLIKESSFIQLIFVPPTIYFVQLLHSLDNIWLENPAEYKMVHEIKE